jgi:hypothetical protein
LTWFARWGNEPLFSTTPHFFPPKEKTVNAKKEKKGDFLCVPRNAASSFPKKRPAKLENRFRSILIRRMFGSTKQRVLPPNHALT